MYENFIVDIVILYFLDGNIVDVGEYMNIFELFFCFCGGICVVVLNCFLNLWWRECWILKMYREKRVNKIGF